MLHKTGFVYVIGPEKGLQKIGLATDPHARLAALRTASPFELHVHAAIPVPFRQAHAVEQRAHKLLAGCRVRNEWFETTPADAVAAIQVAAAPLIGKVTTAPEPAKIWPPASQWRISRAPQAPRRAEQGLPLFEFSRPGPTHPDFTCNAPIEALRSYRMEVKCCGSIVRYALSQLVPTLPLGSKTPLSVVVARFRCEWCHKPAREALLIDHKRR